MSTNNIQLPKGFQCVRIIGDGPIFRTVRAREDRPNNAGTGDYVFRILHSSLSKNQQTADQFYEFFQTYQRITMFTYLPRVYSVSVGPDGLLYVKEEYVQGQPIFKFLKEHPKFNSVPLLEQVCEALHAAHVRNVYHLCLAPKNVLVRDDGKKIKLVGFGTAAALEHMALISSDWAMFVAPEVLEGKTYDGQADIFSLAQMIRHLFPNLASNNVLLKSVASRPHERFAKIREFESELAAVFSAHNLVLEDLVLEDERPGGLVPKNSSKPALPEIPRQPEASRPQVDDATTIPKATPESQPTLKVQEPISSAVPTPRGRFQRLLDRKPLAFGVFGFAGYYIGLIAVIAVALATGPPSRQVFEEVIPCSILSTILMLSLVFAQNCYLRVPYKLSGMLKCIPLLLFPLAIHLLFLALGIRGGNQPLPQTAIFAGSGALLGILVGSKIPNLSRVAIAPAAAGLACLGLGFSHGLGLPIPVLLFLMLPPVCFFLGFAIALAEAWRRTHWIEVKWPDGAVRLVTLGTKPVRIGSSLDNDLVDTSLMPLAATIAMVDDTVIVADSVNPAYVPFRNGDYFCLGNLSITARTRAAVR